MGKKVTFLPPSLSLAGTPANSTGPRFLAGKAGRGVRKMPRLHSGVRVHFSRARSVGHEDKNTCNSCTYSKNAMKINYIFYTIILFLYTIQIQDLFLFIYLFIYCGKTRSSVSVFNLFLTNINTALQPATLSSEMQCEFPLEC